MILNRGNRYDRGRISLDNLCAPIKMSLFWSRYWQQEELIGPVSAKIEALLSLSDIDNLIASLSSPGDGIVIRPHEPVKKHNHVALTLSAAYSAYCRGDTILLTRLERRWPPITTLCDSITDVCGEWGIQLKKGVGANMYLTPESSQAFPPHYDDHDVFILQINGMKEWKLFEKDSSFPNDRQTQQIDEADLPPIKKELTLKAGQVMYIPRGMYHEAHTLASPSLHLTIALFPLTWSELLTRSIGQRTDLSAALPGGKRVRLCGLINERIVREIARTHTEADIHTLCRPED